MLSSLPKKRGERGNTFKVVNHCGQLSHLQSELVDPLWSLHAAISVLFSFSHKMKCVYNYCVQVVFFMRRFRFRQSATNRYQSIPIYLAIGIDNRYQSITTRIFAIDWSSIININRLIDIDCYRLISIVIDYRFHRLDTPGNEWPETCMYQHPPSQGCGQNVG